MRMPGYRRQPVAAEEGEGHQRFGASMSQSQPITLPKLPRERVAEGPETGCRMWRIR